MEHMCRIGIVRPAHPLCMVHMQRSNTIKMTIIGRNPGLKKLHAR